MYGASVGKKQLGKTAAVIAGVVALAAIGVLIAKGGGSADERFAGETEEQREEFLLSYDIQVDQTSSVAKVMVPEEFDERFLDYNDMLKSTGFDLEPLRGETVTKCTYLVTNRPELGEVKAIVLVSDGFIVGGHLLDSKSGELYPLNHGAASGEQASDEDGAQETLLPAVSEEAAAASANEINYDEIPAGAFPSE